MIFEYTPLKWIKISDAEYYTDSIFGRLFLTYEYDIDEDCIHEFLRLTNNSVSIYPKEICCYSSMEFAKKHIENMNQNYFKTVILNSEIR